MTTFLECFAYCSPVTTDYVECNDNDEGTFCLGNTMEGILITVVEFVAHKYPHSLTRLRHINKHWHNCLNPDTVRINLIWEKNICRAVFPYISKHLKIKRWDLFLKYQNLTNL